MIEEGTGDLVTADVAAVVNTVNTSSLPIATRRPPLTPLRALLLVTIGRYLERARLQEVREGISELEIQKLAYFLETYGADYPLHFARGHYGPYADTLAHVLEALEGHYLTCYGDRSARVSELVPITPAPGAVSEAEAILTEHPDDTARVERLLELVDGFETPYSLALLATVHFAACQSPPSADAEVLGQRVTDWGLRKARLFTQDHVEIATHRLAEHHLVPG